MRWEYAERYSPIGRFLLLFFVWGTVGYSYKVFMNLSVPTFMLSMLFFAMSALIMLGLFTRLSMLALGGTVLAHGYMLHSMGSVLIGGVTALSSLLPLGAYYSLDRYIQLRAKPADFVPEIASAKAAPPWAGPLTVALLLFIIGGPTYNQALHHPSEAFRAWDMFHVIARNFVNAHFYVEKDGRRTEIDYVETLGHKVKMAGVHMNKRAMHDMQIVGADQLDAIIARVCAKVPDPSLLRVQANITTLKQGWKPLYTGTEPVCQTHLAGVAA